MKIDILIYAYESSLGEMGGVRKPIELAKGLEALGHSTTVFVPDFLQVREGAVELVSYRTVSVPLLRPLSAYLSMNWNLWRRSRHTPPDIVYARTGRNFLSGMLARLIGARFVFEVNGDAFGEQGWSQGILRALSVLAADWINCRFAHRVIAVTPGLDEMVRRRYRVPSQKVCCIGSGTNLEEIHPLDPHSSREKLGISSDTPTIVFLGVLYKHQGIQVLLAAMPQILAGEPQACIVIVGDGPMMDSLRDQATRLGVDGSVLFAGSVPYEEIGNCLGAATLCVAPFLSGRGEASPLKLFDYMAAGRPIVASEIPSISDILRESGSSLPVPPEDPSSLADKCLQLFRDPQRCRQLGDAGRRYVEEHHGWTRIAEMMLSACANGSPEGRNRTA